MSEQKRLSTRSVLTIKLVLACVLSMCWCAPAIAQARETAPVEFRSAARYSEYRIPEGADYAPVTQGSPLGQPDTQYYEKVAQAREQAERQRLAAEQAAQQQARANAINNSQPEIYSQAGSAQQQYVTHQSTGVYQQGIAQTRYPPVTYGQAGTQIVDTNSSLNQQQFGTSANYANSGMPQTIPHQAVGSLPAAAPVANIYATPMAPLSGGVAGGGALIGAGVVDHSFKQRELSGAGEMSFSNEDLMGMNEGRYDNAASMQSLSHSQHQQTLVSNTSTASVYSQPSNIPAYTNASVSELPVGDKVEVLAGDTLYSLSTRYRVALRALVETNDLQPPFRLEVGSFVHLPPPNIHVVETGETLYAISRRYNVDTRSLANMNGLPKPWTIYPGDQMILPSLARDSFASESTAIASAKARDKILRESKGIAAPIVGQTATASSPSAVQLGGDQQAGRGLAVDSAKLAVKNEALGRFDESAPVSAIKTSEKIDLPGDSKGFVWPVNGNIIKTYGQMPNGKINDGVNIAARAGSTIKAASDGYVVYAGSELPGFGLLILINHGNGWVSAYAHAEELLVEENQPIRQGQAIAKVGETGSVDRPQLHFQLRRGKSPIDPASHLLPKRSI